MNPGWPQRALCMERQATGERFPCATLAETTLLKATAGLAFSEYSEDAADAPQSTLY